MKNNVVCDELRDVAEVLNILNRLPEHERIAVKYYIKGRFDAEAGNIDIPPQDNSKAEIA